MDFALSPEQLLIKDNAARLAASCAPGQHWARLSELGFLALGAPEALGGFGGPLETLLLLEQLGRGAAITPFVAQVVYAGAVLRAAGCDEQSIALTEGERRFAVAAEAGVLAAGSALSGRSAHVLDADSADVLLVRAQADGAVALFAVDARAPGVRVSPLPAPDGARVADVHFDAARAELLARGEPAELALDEGFNAAVAGLCAEGLGLIAAMLEMTVEYTKQRRQFGVPISSFQALQHRMAEMYVQAELARSMAYRAAMVLESETDPGLRRRGVSAAKVQLARSGRFVGQHAVQLHGGIGMSEEYKLGRYFKRMTTLERLLGDAEFHLARYREGTARPRTVAV